MEQEKTREQLQKEMFEQMQGKEYMSEIATPGIVRPVDPEDTTK